MKINKLNEEIKVDVLDNGLRVYQYQNPNFTSMYANYTVDFGSIDTDYEFELISYTDPKGIAHYLEHLMFADGSNDYFDYFSKLGANANAYTSFNQTSYLFSAASDYEENLKILTNMVQTLNIDEERVKDEFGVIKEEIEMYNSKPNFVLQNMLFENMCTSNYKYDIAGSIDSISQINFDDIKRLFDIFYAPSNATLFIASNVIYDLDFLNGIQIIKEQKSKVNHKRQQEKLIVNKEENIEISNVASESQIMFGYKYPLVKDVKEMMLADVSFEIFTIWLTSDLNENYTKAVKEGRLNESLNGYHILDKTINCQVFKIRENAPQLIQDYLEQEIQSLTLEKIEIIKRKKIGSEIKLFNNPENVCEFGLDLILRGININDYFEFLYKVDSNEILEYLKSSIKQKKTTVQILRGNEEEF